MIVELGLVWVWQNFLNSSCERNNVEVNYIIKIQFSYSVKDTIKYTNNHI